MTSWRTTSITPLAPGITVTLSYDEGGENNWPAIALLQQVNGDRERIVLGVLNGNTGTVDPVDAEGTLADIRYAP